jgi:hypothetical protein
MHQDMLQNFGIRIVTFSSKVRLIRDNFRVWPTGRVAIAVGLLILIGLFPLILTSILSIAISPKNIDRLGNWTPFIVAVYRGNVVSLLTLIVFCGCLQASFAKPFFSSLVALVILGSAYRLAFQSLFPNVTYFDEAILRDCASIGSISFTLAVVARFKGWILCQSELKQCFCRHWTFSLQDLLQVMVLIGLLASICRLQSAPKWEVVRPPSWQRIEFATVSFAIGFLSIIILFLVLGPKCRKRRLVYFCIVLAVIVTMPNLAIAIRESATGFELSISNRLDVLYSLIAFVFSQFLALNLARLLSVRFVKLSNRQKLAITSHPNGWTTETTR